MKITIDTEYLTKNQLFHLQQFIGCDLSEDQYHFEFDQETDEFYIGEAKDANEVDLLDISIRRCGLTERVVEGLIREGIYKLGDLVLVSEKFLQKTPGFGFKALKEIKDMLTVHGLKLNDIYDDR
jgi:DNA-directed RNA polymerase alpha subunit